MTLSLLVYLDADQHLRVCDVVPQGNPFQLRVRLKRIKQDPRLERQA